jgi:hypothetical protein
MPSGGFPAGHNPGRRLQSRSKKRLKCVAIKEFQPKKEKKLDLPEAARAG